MSRRHRPTRRRAAATHPTQEHSEGETEPAETPAAGTEEPEAPPPGSETPPDDTTEPTEGTPPTEGTDPAEPPPPAEECTAGAAGCEPAEEPACDAGATTAPPATTAITGSRLRGRSSSSSRSPPPRPRLRPLRRLPHRLPPGGSVRAGRDSIVLLISDAGPGPSAGPSHARARQRPRPRRGSALDLDLDRRPGWAGRDRGAGGGGRRVPHCDRPRARPRTLGREHGVLAASRTVRAALERRDGTALGHLPELAARIDLDRRNTAHGDRSIIPPAPPPPDTPLERHRRTHPEAQSDTERPAVAVAPATSTRDHGRRLSGGGAPGGSSAAAGLRIFAVSTSPLFLTAPVTFPTEPQPSVLPEGEPGVPPPASPG